MVLAAVEPVLSDQFVVFVNETFPNTERGCRQALANSQLTINFTSRSDTMDVCSRPTRRRLWL